jgi:hypothetical protein
LLAQGPQQPPIRHGNGAALVLDMAGVLLTLEDQILRYGAPMESGTPAR